MTALAVALAAVRLVAANPVLAAVGPPAAKLSAGKNVGLVIGVYRAGTPRVYGFGTAATPTGVARPDGKTLFEIGSVTKVFTGVLLADAVRRGEVKLDDPVNRHLPTDLWLNAHEKGVPITLLDLATHRGGLPVEPPLIGLTAGDSANPYADFTRTRLAALTRQLTPVRPPGEREVYSNLGAGLLGHALANVAGQPSYHALIQDRVCGPFNLRDTTEAPTGAQRARLARGHDAAGARTAPRGTSPAWRGAGHYDRRPTTCSGSPPSTSAMAIRPWPKSAGTATPKGGATWACSGTTSS